MKLFVVLFTAVPLIFVAVGTYMAASQHQKITTWQPVQATVLSARVEQHTSRDSDGRSSTTYKPVIEYRYEVDGRSYTCDKVTPLSETRSGGWARRIANRYKAGRACEAYYDPQAPAEAFLVREYSFFPYLFILFPVPFLAIGAGVHIAVGASQGAPPEPVPCGGGWYEIKPTSRIADRRRAALLVTVVWHGVGVLACGHFFTAAGPPYETLSIVCTLIYEALGCIPLSLAIYYHLLGRQFGDASVSVNAPEFARGDQFAVYAQQPVYLPVLILEMSVGLVCEKTTQEKRGSKTTISAHPDYERWATALENYNAKPGDTLVADQTLPIPEDKNPSSPPGCKGYPRYAWRVELVTRVAGKPDYRAKFPITVRALS